MKKIRLTSVALFFLATNALAQSQLPSCVGNDARRWTNCQGVHNFTNGDRYEGEFRDGKFNGWGSYFHLANNQFRGDKYTGQFLNGSRHGSGRYLSANGNESLEGSWSAGVFVKFEKIGLDTNLIFNCKECKSEFSILPYQFYYRINQKNSICTQCFPISENSSIDQAELYNFIKCNYDGEIIQNTKSIIAPYEIDIYLPALKIGFEFNGVFWHSAKFKKNDYHLKKYNEGVKNDVRIITIWEDDWTTKREICQSFILNKIRKVNRVMARKTILREVDYLSSKDFLYKNHLQGDCKSSIRLGLYHEGELVSLMTFSKLRMPLGGKNTENTYELTRFCNSINTSVTGGASKLKKYFIEKYKPVEIQTYSDNLISDGELYEKLGFNNESDSKPGYWYVVNGIREHRFNWRKQRLIKMGNDKEKTEEEIMAELGYWRIYNAGNKKWIWRIN